MKPALKKGDKILWKENDMPEAEMGIVDRVDEWKGSYSYLVKKPRYKWVDEKNVINNPKKLEDFYNEHS